MPIRSENIRRRLRQRARSFRPAAESEAAPLEYPQCGCRGATIIEYVLLVAVVGLSITFVLVIFEPQSQQFYDSSKTGRETSYPTNFIPEPTPTAAVSPTPA